MFLKTIFDELVNKFNAVDAAEVGKLIKKLNTTQQ